ncbi:MAG: hypothetical protein MUD14_22000 [Hydrococcus sp. Prado102]|nr:hypothetical protein [Hydrococcus sp. Prado102]
MPKNAHERTCKLVRKCLEETNKEYIKKLDNRLKRKKGIKSRFEYFLFTQPYINILVSIILFYLFLFIGYFIVIYFKETWIRLVFLASYIIFSLAIPIIITILTPKVKRIWDKQWKKNLQKYLEKTQLQNKKNEAKQRFNRAILYYRRKGKPINFLVNLLWGGIIIGCLPDTTFQEALTTTKPVPIWNANPLGAIGLIVLPFVYIYNSVRYDIPIAWLENILAQIELEE